jgi:hypothetical protein
MSGCALRDGASATQRPESQSVRSLYDCPQVPVGPEAVLCRGVVATHPAGNQKRPVGLRQAGVV